MLKSERGDWPEVAFVVGTLLFAGDGVGLTGDSSPHGVDALATSDFAKVIAALWAADGSKVAVDRCFIQ